MNALIGTWVFVAVIYNGEIMPKPNPALPSEAQPLKTDSAATTAAPRTAVRKRIG